MTKLQDKMNGKLKYDCTNLVIIVGTGQVVCNAVLSLRYRKVNSMKRAIMAEGIQQFMPRLTSVTA